MLQAPIAHAASIVVNTTADNSTNGDRQCSLREAINNANAHKDTSGGDCVAGTGNDTITFSVSGTITLVQVLPTLKSTIAILGPGPTLDGNGNHSILRVNAPGATVTLTSMTLSNGVCNSQRNGGGAITHLSQSTLNINGGVFTSNDASDCDGGGAIRNNQGGVLNINGTQFSGNTAVSGLGFGGAILNLGVLSITNQATFSDNTAANGGAIANLPSATVSVNQATFRNNRGWDYGGGIYNNSTEGIYLNYTTLDENATGLSGYGGGIANLSGSVTVTNSTFSNGYAKRGGALYTENGGVILTGDTLVNNRGWGSGGGIYNTNTHLTITNSTLTQNTTDGYYGGAIYTELYSSEVHVVNSTLAANTSLCNNSAAAGIYSSDSRVWLSNTILANNVNGCQYDCTGTGNQHQVIADGHNLAYNPDLSCGKAKSVTTDDLQLGPLQDNGGPTQTMRPGGGSVARSAGDDAVCAAAVGSPNFGAGGVDQRGVKRPQGKHCDVGAYEVRGQ
jgi:CSLREA domain-containing protein